MPKQPVGLTGGQVWLAILGVIVAVPLGFCCMCSGVISLTSKPADLASKQAGQGAPPLPTPPARADDGPPPEVKPVNPAPVTPEKAPPKDPFAGGEVLEVRPQEVPAFPTGSLALVRTPRSSFTPAYRNEESRKAGRSYGVLNGEGVRVITPGPRYTTVEILTGTYGGNTADVPTASLAEIPPPKPRHSAGYTQAELDAMAANQLPIAIPAIGGTGGRGPVHVQGYYRNGRWVSGYYRGR